MQDAPIAAEPRAATLTGATLPFAPVWSRLSVAAFFFANGGLMASFVSRIPAIQLKLGLNTGALGLALLGAAVGAIVGMPAAGALAARFGSRVVTMCGLVIMCAALPLIALAPSLWLLALAIGLLGLGNGSTDVAMNTQAIAVQRAYGRSIMPSFHALYSTGGMLGALVGGWYAGRGTAPVVHFLTASLVLLAVALAALPAAVGSDHQEREESAGAARAPGLRWPSPVLIALGAISFCSMLGEGAMADWSAVYLHRSLLTDPQIAAYGYASFSVAMAIGRFGGDALTHRFGSVALVRICGAVAAAGLAGALIVDTVPATLIGFALVGAGFSIVVPLCFSAAGNAPGLPPGPSIAIVSTIGYTGFLVGPPFIGFAAEVVHLRGALGIVVVTSALIAVLAGYAAAEPVRPDNRGSEETASTFGD